MVEKKVRYVKVETIEKRGVVSNAQNTFEKLDKLRSDGKESKDFGQVNFTDQEIEEAIKKDESRNKHLENTEKFLKGYRK